MDRHILRILKAILFHDLTEASGDAFQKLIAKYFTAAYGSDFERIKSAGRSGDGGCDGYHRSTKTVYQCYGKEKSAPVNSRYIAKKIKEDFALARRTYKGDQMLEWVFVHNLVGGLPNEANLAIIELQAKNPDVSIRTMSQDAFEDLLFKLGDESLQDLFGPTAARSFGGIDPSDIQRLLNRLVSEAETPVPTAIKPVPLQKIDYNRLTEMSARTIRDNTQYTAQVGKFVNDASDAQLGDRIATKLRAKYQSLKLDKFSPDDILNCLADFIIGADRIACSVGEVRAADAILAYFFDRCDIFEDEPLATA
jgi:hypothetical protein